MILPNQKARILAVLFGRREHTAEDEKWAWRAVLHIILNLYEHKRPRLTGKRGRPLGASKPPPAILRQLLTAFRTYSGETPKVWRHRSNAVGGMAAIFISLVLKAAGREYVVHGNTLIRAMRAERALMRSAFQEQRFTGWSPLDPTWRSAREKFAHDTRE